MCHKDYIKIINMFTSVKCIVFINVLPNIAVLKKTKQTYGSVKGSQNDQMLILVSEQHRQLNCH